MTAPKGYRRRNMGEEIVKGDMIPIKQKYDDLNLALIESWRPISPCGNSVISISSPIICKIRTPKENLKEIGIPVGIVIASVGLGILIAFLLGWV